LTTLCLWDNQIDNTDIDTQINEKLKINNINTKKFQCLQILCIKKLKQLNRIHEVQTLCPVIYDSCMMKYLHND